MKAQPTFSLPSPALSANYCIMAGLYTPRQAKRKQMVRLIGVGIGRSMAWLPIIPFAFHICQVLIAKRLSLSQDSCHGTRFMLLFAHSYALRLTAHAYCAGRI